MAARMLITPVLPEVAEPAAAAWAWAPAVASRAAPASRAARIRLPRNREAVVILEFTVFLLVLKKIFEKFSTYKFALRISSCKIDLLISRQISRFRNFGCGSRLRSPERELPIQNAARPR